MHPPTHAQLARLALVILRGRTSTPAPVPTLPQTAFHRSQQLSGLAEDCRRRGWAAAGRLCRDRLRRSLAELRRQLDALLSELDRPVPKTVLSLSDIIADLASLESEFDPVNVYLRERAISVTTGEFMLGGLAFGPFEILLELDRLGSTTPYTVVAVGGSPAASDSSVTHPHVRDERLCEGEAHAAIRGALAAGRILDFFLVVRQTLSTYNPDSAYVGLDQWDGGSCADCGCHVASDERTLCERCDDELCDDCYGSCTACGRYLCASCGAPCTACHENHCESCLATCCGCNNLLCERCLTNEQCSRCRDAAAQEEAHGETQTDSPPAATAGPSADPDRLVQAAVSP